MRVGLLGGTFNPPHVGHLVCALEARQQLRLDVVHLLPAAVPPHKEVPDDPGVDVRIEMCRAAVGGDDRLGVCDVEARREGPSYTVDTLRELNERSPEDELTFIVGGDMALSLPTWRDPPGILALAQLGIAERDGVRRHDIAERLEALTTQVGRLRFFDMPRLDVSSSLLRRRVAEGRELTWLVPQPVIDVIEERGLYRADSAVPERVGETT